MPLLQIDPESLALHVNADAIGSSPNSAQNLLILELCLAGHYDETLLGLYQTEDPSERLEAIDFLSKYVHEYRHFIDLIYSPYGWYRLRYQLELARYLPGLLSSNDIKVLPIPLSTAANPADLAFLGLEPSKTRFFERVVGAFDSRRTTMNWDNMPIRLGEEQSLQIGGESVLEGLAFLSQRAWIGTHFETEYWGSRFKELRLPQKDQPLYWQYAWSFLLVEMAYDNANLEIEDKYLVTFIAGLMFAALSGNTFDVELRSVDASEFFLKRDISGSVPRNRMEMVIEHLPKMSAKIHGFEDIVPELSRVTEEIFGKDFLSEIQMDIQKNREFVEEECEQLKNYGGEQYNYLPHMFLELLDYRDYVHERVISQPLLLIEPRLFSPRNFPDLIPKGIYTFCRGLTVDEGFEYLNQFVQLEELEGTWSALHHIRSLNFEQNKINEIYYTFLRLYLDFDTHKFNPQMGYHYFYQTFVPIYKFLTYGYQYHSMHEVELITGRQSVEREKKIVMDPAYERVRRVYGRYDLWRVIQRDEYRCDCCGRIVTFDACSVASPLTMRTSPLWGEIQARFLAEFRLRGVENAEASSKAFFNEMYERDWSDWALCNTCLERLGH